MASPRENKDDQYNPKEAAKRRDEALKRALNTPPTPHTNLGEVAPTKPNKAKKEKPGR
jgi:hypothetical protein